MKSQPKLFLSGAFAAIIAASSFTSCTTMSNTTADGTKKVDWLFVQNSTGLSATKDRITLRGINPQTVCFSDRPERMAGHMTTADFVPMWSKGSDSFLKDPPNATLSVLHDGKVESSVVTLRNPRLKSGNLTYDITLLEGSIPTKSGACSLFIDVIGMPCTPYSFAGAARRRAFAYDSAAAYPAVVAAPAYAPVVAHYGYYGASAARYSAYGTTAAHRGYYGGTAVHSGPYGETAVHRGAYGTTAVRRR